MKDIAGREGAGGGAAHSTIRGRCECGARRQSGRAAAPGRAGRPSAPHTQNISTSCYYTNASRSSTLEVIATFQMYVCAFSCTYCVVWWGKRA
ncbi:hypothetical protein EVAR_41666_1 [Eumeta japonica]|uniref:Uncharacterized protein n=1 Tax=Eumeta variegata TaxID=151549 RepID=A0A4C1VN96_EUMVA|nr:hypothetical protein EVAR_41666_1 [Eumeta japonica]